MTPNRFPARCATCDRAVEAGAGTVHKRDGERLITHVECELVERTNRSFVVRQVHTRMSGSRAREMNFRPVAVGAAAVIAVLGFGAVVVRSLDGEFNSNSNRVVVTPDGEPTTTIGTKVAGVVATRDGTATSPSNGGAPAQPQPSTTATSATLPNRQRTPVATVPSGADSPTTVPSGPGSTTVPAPTVAPPGVTTPTPTTAQPSTTLATTTRPPTTLPPTTRPPTTLPPTTAPPTTASPTTAPPTTATPTTAPPTTGPPPTLPSITAPATD